MTNKPVFPLRSNSMYMTRRTLLAGAAFVLTGITSYDAGLAAQPSSAADGEQASFLALSHAVTGQRDLSPHTAGRIYEAFLGDDPTFSKTVQELGRLATQNPQPNMLKAAAAQQGLGDAVMAIVTAWYTGTVTTRNGPVVVAYHDALMYRPVADGLVVPTYCNKGPIWWTDLPPEISRMPVNVPKVL